MPNTHDQLPRITKGCIGEYNNNKYNNYLYKYPCIKELFTFNKETYFNRPKYSAHNNYNKLFFPEQTKINKLSGLGCLTAITTLFNWCLRAHTTPKQWKKGYIFPISKKPIFDGNLVNTRPISLVEHIRKLYTKLFTNRLNKTFTQHQILSPFNYVALPGNSTSIPIHILNNVIEDACCNSKPIWLISQDMSKAYDSVQFELFAKALLRICMPQPLIDTLTNLLFDCHN